MSKIKFNPKKSTFARTFIALASSIALVSSVAGAASPAIPEQFRGDWCTDEEEGDFLSPIMHRCKTYNDTSWRIQAHTYGSIKPKVACTFTSISFNTGREGKEKVTEVSTDSLCGRDKLRSIFRLQGNFLIFLTVEIAGAASPAIPEQFRGDWCFEEGNFLSPILHRCKTYSNTNFRIQAHTYGTIKSNWDCTFTSISKKDRRLVSAALSQEVTAVSTDSLCVRDTTVKMRSIFELQGNILIFLSVDIRK
jgi:hypothetical protein